MSEIAANKTGSAVVGTGDTGVAWKPKKKKLREVAPIVKRTETKQGN